MTPSVRVLCSLLVSFLRCVQLPMLSILQREQGERRVSNRWSRIEAALSDEISNDSLRGRSVCCIAVCVSAWCQLSSVCLPGASWALTLATVSIWLSTGACCVPVTPPPLSDGCSLCDHIEYLLPTRCCWMFRLQ